MILLIKELIKKIENNQIKNEDLIVCLESENLRVVAMAIFKIIERNYCDDRIIERLVQLGELTSNNKFMGPWQFGHVALATLALVDNVTANEVYNNIFVNLKENDKFLIENFIQSESYK